MLKFHFIFIDFFEIACFARWVIRRLQKTKYALAQYCHLTLHLCFLKPKNSA